MRWYWNLLDTQLEVVTVRVDVEPFPPPVSTEAPLLHASGEAQHLLSDALHKLSLVGDCGKLVRVVDGELPRGLLSGAILDGEVRRFGELQIRQHRQLYHIAEAVTARKRRAAEAAESMLHLAAEIQNREKLLVGDFQT